MQQIPPGQPVGDEYSTIHLITGVLMMVLCFVGIVLYLRWKLPRSSDEPEDSPGPDDEQ